MIFFDLHKSFEFGDLIKRFKLAELLSRLKPPCFLVPAEAGTQGSLAGTPAWGSFYCRVQLTKQQCNPVSDTFNMEICGSVYAPTDPPGTDVTLRISIMDVTEGMRKAKPVQSQVKQWSVLDGSVPGSSAFYYSADLGRLPNKITTLSDWTAVAHLSTDWLIFPRKGKRNLQFSTSVLSRQNGQELACAKCNFAYSNPKFGYLDVKENIQRTKNLAVALAFAVSAADCKLYDCEIELIKKWARFNFDHVQTSDKARRKLEKALDKTVAFFRNGNQLDTAAICKDIIESAPASIRYDILDLCLRVVQAKGSVATEELAILKDLASWLEVDMNRFRAMMEKTLPIRLHQGRDVEATLGVTTDMSREKTRRQLNKEYCKWNSRATSSNPEIRAQADQMLKLIAEARCQFIG